MAMGEIYQLTLVSILNTVPVANVFYLEVLDDTGTTDAMADAAAALETQVVTDLRVFQSNEVVYECILGRRVLPTTSPARVFNITATGALVQEPFPANVAIVVRHYSDTGDKNRRGRYFLAGLSKIDTQNGRIVQGLAASIQTFIATISDPIVDSPRVYLMKHFSRKLGLYFTIESGTVDPVPTKVRNRTPGICSIS